MKIPIAMIALLSLAGFVRADDLDDTFTNLKDAVAQKKSADEILTLATQTSKLARAAAVKPKPEDVEAESYQQRIQFAKDADSYTEYALSSTAVQTAEPAKVVALVDQLIAENPKSTYLDGCAAAYLSALNKQGGAAKMLDGAAKINAGRPENELALSQLAEGYASKSPDRAVGYANKLLGLMKTKAKPEGVSDADWAAQKNALTGTAYYVTGIANFQKQVWVDCDRDLKASLPYIGKDSGKLSTAYFALGVCNYQFGKLTQDRTRIQAGEKFSEQSAAIAGPMQAQARTNVAAMQRELGAGTGLATKR